MPLSNTDSEIMMLYEVASLSDELRDEGSKLLLQWAEKQVTWLAEREKSGSNSDEAFQAQCVTLHRLMKRAGRLVGRWHDLAPEEQQEHLAKLVETGRELGYHVDEAKVSAFKATSVPSEQEGIAALLSAFATDAAADTEAAAPAAAAAQADLLADLGAVDTTPADEADGTPDAQSPEM